MRIYLSNYHYRAQNSGGGSLHIEAFVRHALAAGHELWSKPCLAHPGVRHVAPHLLGQWRRLVGCDLHYVRIEWCFPRRKLSRWFTPPLRGLVPGHRLVWEFNTIPEYGSCEGASPADIARQCQAFRAAAPWCDLAVCVSEPIADYVRTRFGVRQTLVIPNGAVLPDAPRVPRRDDTFNVIWAGSAQLDWHDLNLINEAARILSDDPGAARLRFHFYGPGTESFAGKSANLVVHGPCPHEQVRTACAEMNAGLCLYREGAGDYSSPLKYFDYLAAGLPVITSPHPQMDGIQQSIGANELIIGDRSAAGLARTLIGLANNPARHAELSSRAEAIIRERYNWPRLMAELFEHLEAMVANGPARRRRPASPALKPTSPKGAATME